MAGHSDSDFMELLELQGDLEMVTKSELMEKAREIGVSISDRQLTALVSEGLLPKSARIGSRGGAFPGLAVDQLWFVTSMRKFGLSVQAVKELLPLWRFLQRSIREHEVSLAELERIARQSITVPDAWFAVPSVIQTVLPCSIHDRDGICNIKFVMKDGERCSVADGCVSIGFIMARQVEETGEVKTFMPHRIAIPQADEGYNPSSIILGIPNGVPLPPEDGNGTVNVLSGPAQGRGLAEEGD